MSIEYIPAASKLALPKNITTSAETYSNGQKLQQSSQPQGGTTTGIVVNQTQRRSVQNGKQLRQQQMVASQQYQQHLEYEQNYQQQQQQKIQQLQQTAIKKTSDLHNARRISSLTPTINSTNSTNNHDSGINTNGSTNATKISSTGVAVNDNINKNTAYQSMEHDLLVQTPPSSAKAISISTSTSDSAPPSPASQSNVATPPSAAPTLTDDIKNNVELCERLEWSAAQSLVEMNAKDKHRRSTNISRNSNIICNNSKGSTSTTSSSSSSSSNLTVHSPQQHQKQQNQKRIQLPTTNALLTSASSNKIDTNMDQTSNIKTPREYGKYFGRSPTEDGKVIFYAPPAGGLNSNPQQVRKCNHKTVIKIENSNTISAQAYRERSIAETEAAHDLLSLSQSLPPLTPPCVVTIMPQDTNGITASSISSSATSSPRCTLNTHKSQMQEISSSSKQQPHQIHCAGIIQPDNLNGYINTDHSHNNSGTSKIRYVSSFDSHQQQIRLNMQHSHHSNHHHHHHNHNSVNSSNNCSPLTPPNSDHSSDIDIDIDMSSSSESGHSNSHQPLQIWRTDFADGPAKNDLKIYLNIVDGRTKACKKKGEQNGKSETNKKPKRGCYKCSECGKQYATSSNLSRHKQTHRSLDSQSAKKCNTCGKAYVSMPALAMHLLTHKLSHGCDICGKLFSRPWLLQGHLRSHTGEKPYACVHCGKAFADRSNLRAHMMTHSVDKNFECKRCHKSFALKSYLNKHLESACIKETGHQIEDDGDGMEVCGTYNRIQDSSSGSVESMDSGDENEEDIIVA